MPIQLTTPFSYSPGHGQPSEDYNIVMLIDFRVRIIERSVTFSLIYGNIVDEVWVPGQAPPNKITVKDKPAVMGQGIDPEDGVWKTMEVEPADPAFTTLSNNLAVKAEHVGIPHLMAVGGDLYQYFVDAGYYAGTVIP